MALTLSRRNGTAPHKRPVAGLKTRPKCDDDRSGDVTSSHIAT